MSYEYGTITPQLLRYKADIEAMARHQEALQGFRDGVTDITADLSPQPQANPPVYRQGAPSR